MNKAQRRRSFMLNSKKFPMVVAGAGTWFEVVDALEIHGVKCPGGNITLLRMASRIRGQCKKPRERKQPK